TAHRARRHRARVGRRRHGLPADGRGRGLARDRLAQAVEPGEPVMTRRSVTIAVTRSCGVTSKAGLTASAHCVISPGPRSSMGTAAPYGVSRSMVDSGATTTNGIPAARAPRAWAYVPIL